MGSEMTQCMVDEENEDVVQWQTDEGLVKQVTLPQCCLYDEIRKDLYELF